MSNINNPPCQVVSLSGEGSIKSRLVAVLADLEASRELLAAAYVQTALEALERADTQGCSRPAQALG